MGKVINGKTEEQINAERLEDNETDIAAFAQQKGTTCTPTFNADGTVQKLTYKDTSGTTVREDVFTYTANTIIEVRTVGSNTTTYTYNLNTLLTEVS